MVLEINPLNESTFSQNDINVALSNRETPAFYKYAATRVSLANHTLETLSSIRAIQAQVSGVSEEQIESNRLGLGQIGARVTALETEIDGGFYF